MASPHSFVQFYYNLDNIDKYKWLVSPLEEATSMLESLGVLDALQASSLIQMANDFASQMSAPSSKSVRVGNKRKANNAPESEIIAMSRRFGLHFSETRYKAYWPLLLDYYLLRVVKWMRMHGAPVEDQYFVVKECATEVARAFAQNCGYNFRVPTFPLEEVFTTPASLPDLAFNFDVQAVNMPQQAQPWVIFEECELFESVKGPRSVPLSAIGDSGNLHEDVGRVVCTALGLTYFSTRSYGGCVRLVEAFLQAICGGHVASCEALDDLQDNQLQVLHLLNAVRTENVGSFTPSACADFLFAMQQFSQPRSEHFSVVRDRNKWGDVTEPVQIFGVNLVHVSVLTPERWDGGMKVLDADVTVHTGRAESRFAVLVTSFNNSPGHVTLVWADPNE